MASDGSGDEGANPATPSKKELSRPKQRHIIRWTDEKLVIAFAEFRQAAQRFRLDIKKPMEEAARSVGPHCTADALVQQLTKRRHRFLQEQQSLGTSPLAAPLTPTPKRKAATKVMGNSNDKALPTTETADAADAADTQPSWTTTNTPRSSTRRKVKKEPEVDRGLQTPSDNDIQSDSEYTESPVKSKKKRVPHSTSKKSKKSTTKSKKAKSSYDTEEEDDHEDFDASLKEDITTLISSAAALAPDPSTDDALQGMETDQKNTHQLGAGFSPGQVEDVFYSSHAPDDAKEPHMDGQPAMNGSQIRHGVHFMGYPMDPMMLHGASWPDQEGGGGPVQEPYANPFMHFDLNNPTQAQLEFMQSMQLRQAEMLMRSGHFGFSVPPEASQGLPVNALGLINGGNPTHLGISMEHSAARMNGHPSGLTPAQLATMRHIQAQAMFHDRTMLASTIQPRADPSQAAQSPMTGYSSQGGSPKKEGDSGAIPSLASPMARTQHGHKNGSFDSNDGTLSYSASSNGQANNSFGSTHAMLLETSPGSGAFASFASPHTLPHDDDPFASHGNMTSSMFPPLGDGDHHLQADIFSRFTRSPTLGAIEHSDVDDSPQRRQLARQFDNDFNLEA